MSAEAMRTELSLLLEGYETSTHIGRNRLNVEIEARSYAAKVENRQKQFYFESIERISR